MLHKLYCIKLLILKIILKIMIFIILYKELLNFCTVDLSAFYFDIRKDTLYCDPLESKKRQSTIIMY